MTQRKRRADALLEESLIHRDVIMREQPDGDFGFRVVKADAEPVFAVVLHLDDIAVLHVRGRVHDGPGVDPRMPGDDAVGFAGLEDDEGRAGEGLWVRSCL